jgi:hypothetical protein
MISLCISTVRLDDDCPIDLIWQVHEGDEGYYYREQINAGCMEAMRHQVIMPRVVPRVQAAVEEGGSVTPGHLRAHTLRGARI